MLVIMLDWYKYCVIIEYFYMCRYKFIRAQHDYQKTETQKRYRKMIDRRINEDKSICSYPYVNVSSPAMSIKA